MNSSFETRVPAKWVLTGEHSVLRGATALAFPYPALSLNLFYSKTIQGELPSESIQNTVKKAFAWLKISEPHFNFRNLKVESSIPMGSGLGSSAALCVAVARFALWYRNAKSDLLECLALATHLEDTFHGKSSGMDVTVVATGEPIAYTRKNGGERYLQGGKLPRFELIDTGARGKTKECVALVEKAENLDAQMARASEIARAALLSFDESPKESEKQLIEAMKLGESCFESWGLVSPELIKQKERILNEGALAVKMTGAGLGGFWVALYPSS